MVGTWAAARFGNVPYSHSLFVRTDELRASLGNVALPGERVPLRVERGLVARTDVELGVDRAEVRVHGARADRELPANLGIAEPLRQQAQDVQLPRGEGFVRRRPLRARSGGCRSR